MEAVPEIGLKKAMEKIWDGKLTKRVKGFNKNSKTLLSKKRLTAKTIAKMAGKILKTIFNPSNAPSKKVSYTLTFLIKP